MTFCSLQNHKVACPLGKVLNTQLSGGRVEAGTQLICGTNWSGSPMCLCCAPNALFLSRKDPHFLALAEAAFGSIVLPGSFCIGNLHFLLDALPGTRVANAAIA